MTALSQDRRMCIRKTTKEIRKYVGCTCRYGSDVRRALQTLAMPIMIVPADPAVGAPRSIEQMWEKKIDEFVKREAALKENLRTLYTFVWGQCTEIVWARLEALDNYGAMSEEFNSLALLKVIKSI
jgi:GTP:adenosylcobinamide-phosphate guanylyltransferase